MSKVKQISFTLGNIRTEQFAMFEDVLSSHNGTFEINNNGSVSVGGDPTNRVITISVQSDFKIAEKIAMTIEVGTTFIIETSSWKMLKDNNTVTLPKDFVIHLESIALSITRGVLAAKTEGTCFSSYMIPLVNMASLVKDDVKINCQ